jgi:hypothetical protein
MVIDDFDINRVIFWTPDEADAPPIVHPNAVLTFSIAGEAERSGLDIFHFSQYTRG